MSKKTHKKAEHCYEKDCDAPVYNKGLCCSHYTKDYRRRSDQGLITRGQSNKYKGWEENKLTGYYKASHDRPCHIVHENQIFALASGTDYKRMPSILTIDNYESERTVGNTNL